MSKGFKADGAFYRPWSNDWLLVTGIKFGLSEGSLIPIFLPAVQLHIHCIGGRTVAITTTERAIRTSPEFDVTEAGRKLIRRGLNLRKSQDFARAPLKRVIPKAPRPAGHQVAEGGERPVNPSQNSQGRSSDFIVKKYQRRKLSN